MKQISEKKVVAALFPNRKESTATTFFVLVYGFPFLLEIRWNRRNILEHFETRLIKNMI